MLQLLHKDSDILRNTLDYSALRGYTRLIMSRIIIFPADFKNES